MTMTLDVHKMMKRWMVIYMNLNILQHPDEKVRTTLREMKDKLAEANEYVMRFFDMVDADPERA